MKYEERKMKQFFGKNGLTSAEANHYANIAFELVQSKERELNSYSANEIKILVGDRELLYREKRFDESKIIEDMELRPKLYKLSAWLREAVKEKERLLSAIDDDSPVLESLSISSPQLTRVNENWAREQLNVKELADFLACEAEAAAIGKYIHNDGLVKRWQQEVRSDRVFDQAGKVYCITDQVEQKTVDNIFFDLQKKHREAEKKVNFYKAKLKDMVNKENQNRIDAYQKEMRSYEQAVRQTDEYNNKIKEEWEREKIRRREQISSMKIVVPNELQETVNYIKSFAE